MEPPDDPATPVLGIYTQENQKLTFHTQKNLHTKVHGIIYNSQSGNPNAQLMNQQNMRQPYNGRLLSRKKE